MFIRAVIMLAALFLGVSAAGILFITKKIKVGAAAAVIVLLFVVSALALLLPSGRAFLNVPVTSPSDLLSRYCATDFSQQDGEREKLVLSGSSFSSWQCSDYLAGELCSLFLSEIKIEPYGESSESWERVTQSVLLSFPDCAPPADRLAEAAVAALKELGETEPRGILYNSDKTFKKEIVDACMKNAAKTLSFSEGERITARVELGIRCVNGEWRLESDAELYSAVLGVLGGEGSLSAWFDGYVSALRERITSSAGYVPRQFTIDFQATVAPEPDKSCYGATTDPAEVLTVVDRAGALLQGQELVWNPEIEIYPGTQISYYFDDSILAIVWREEMNGTLCTYAEIKLADASQLRRKLVDDCFSPPTSDWIEATRLSEQVNAVVATGSDLYAFRNLGIFSYGGVLYRCETAYVDSCHITRSGDMLFSRRYELYDWNEAQQWITDNDIMFSLAFGPVLIENGEPVITYEYSIGEIWDEYARAAMGQLGEKGSLHYLMLVMSSDSRVSVPEKPVYRDPRLNELLTAMVSKGCSQAYTLDGGQTGAIIIDNEMLTRPTYGWERIYCDILYFATAITPENRIKS